jgi:hypothetical protein
MARKTRHGRSRKATEAPRQSASRPSVAIAPEEIRGLQMLVAQSVSTGDPLPGGTDRVQFPDAAFFSGQDRVVVADDHVAGGEHAGRRGAKVTPAVRVATREQIARRAREEGDLPYLVFGRPLVEGSTVTITVHGRIATQDRTRGEGHLSSATFKFDKSGDAWRLVEGPTYSAA